MLKIVVNPEFRSPVKVYVPGGTGQQEGEFTVRFRALTLSEQAGYDTSNADGTDQFLRAVVLGWDGLTDDAGQPFEFNDANFALLLDLQYFRVALVQAYFSATSGIKAAKRGN